MPERVPCNLCGSEKAIAKPCKGWFLGLPEELAVVECRDCGLTFMNPRPTQGEYNRYYASDHVYSVRAYSQRTESRIDFYQRRIAQIGGFVGKKGRMLEVGCGTGRFLKLARDSGWEVCGTEVSEGFQEFAKERYRVDVHCKASLSDCEFADQTFDFVYGAHVLEHMLDPMGTLREVWRVLKQPGFLLIEVPYQFDSLRDRLRSYAMSITGSKGKGRFYSELISPVHHAYFFSPRTLGAMVQRAGFSVLRMTTYENHHRQVIGDNPLGGYWLTEMMHRAGRLMGIGPIILIWAVKQ